MSWYKIEVPYGKSEYSIVQQFTSLWISALGPKDAALFSNSADFKITMLYFSPGSMNIPSIATLVHGLSGSPSEPPPENATLLVGHADAFELIN